MAVDIIAALDFGSGYGLDRLDPRGIVCFGISVRIRSQPKGHKKIEASASSTTSEGAVRICSLSEARGLTSRGTVIHNIFIHEGIERIVSLLCLCRRHVSSCYRQEGGRSRWDWERVNRKRFLW
ncbi:hypothetical protein I7I48_09026 [Histoplasma ohiense]|nr:hypothetical protein I7I48_09026 [Histoplasma ohiense (nom. inval.)]